VWLDGFATAQQLHSKKHKAPTGAGALMILWLQLYMLIDALHGVQAGVSLAETGGGGTVIVV